MKFKIGDKVRIRKDIKVGDTFKARMYTDRDSYYSFDLVFTEQMEEYKDTTFIVDGGANQEGGIISLKYNDTFWTEDMLEKAPKPILDDTEKSYLSAVIRPFRDRIQHIVKFSYFDSTEFLAFILKDATGSYDENMCLPSFKKRTMYRGMEKDKMYTLKELDL